MRKALRSRGFFRTIFKNNRGMIMEGKIVLDDSLPNIMQGRSLEDAFYDIYTKRAEKGGEA